MLEDFHTPFTSWGICMTCRWYLTRLMTPGVILLASVCAVDPARAQQPAAEQQTQASQASQKETTQEQTTGTSNDRLFFALPNFLTIENASQIPQLTAKHKFAV